MSHRARRIAQRGFTLVELLIVAAVVAVVIMLAAPSFRSFIEVQRVRGVTDQLVTDVQFARAEAASRGETVGISFDDDTNLYCYIVHTCGSVSPSSCRCDCLAAEGSRCTGAMKEIKSVRLDAASGVRLHPVLLNGDPSVLTGVTFDPATGSMSYFFEQPLYAVVQPPEFQLWAVASSRNSTSSARLRTMVNSSGRPSVCSPGGTVSGAASCPP